MGQKRKSEFHDKTNFSKFQRPSANSTLHYASASNYKFMVSKAIN